jgi:GDP-L-fucose synthase
VELTSKRVCVTGGEGFLGSHIVDALHKHGCKEVVVPHHSDFDLRRHEDVREFFHIERPDVVIHAAAMCGGIQSCSLNPGSFLYDNLTMNAEVLEGAREYGVEKFVAISSVCAYPLNVPLPAKEKDIWAGYPEETNAPYGIAKRVLLEQCQAYRKQYGMNCIGLVPVNMYGPRDKFELGRSHVVPSLIRKIIEAKRGNTELTVWGTGKATREFLYVKDCAEAVVLSTKHYNGAEPVNIATGDEVSIERLVSLLISLIGYQGLTNWDVSKPEGQLRRFFDTTQAKKFGFQASTPLWEGLDTTIEWYKTHESSGIHTDVAG